ncbi:MAG: CAP domain-containing protein, partial [Sandaracinaceae bacterium]
ARRHAERTCASGRVSHLDEEGDPEARLAREGIRARHVGETIARAETPSRGWAGMIQSPSHRAALSDRRFTDVGIAEVDDDAGHTCQVVLLAAWPRAVPYGAP